jgi:Calx-beta domain
MILTVLALSACGGSSTGTAPTQPPGSTPAPPTPPAPPGAPATPGTLQLSASTYAVVQTSRNVAITVTRSNGSSGAASVSYATSNGTAVAGTHYTAANGTLSWAGGDATSKTFAVPVSTAAFTGSKTFSVTLSNATGGNVGLPASAVVTITGAGAAAAGNGPAAQLAAKLGLPSRLLLGLGSQAGINTISAVQSQALKVDIYDAYLAGDWTTWNAPPCDYVCVVAGAAKSIDAIPMYTYYEMANNGDGNISVLNDATFMATYWSRLKVLFQGIAASKTPALVNVEPDFWGYVELNAPGHDPTKLAAVVSSNPDCATLANTVAGYAGCVIATARKYAPNAYVGFPPSAWGGNTDADVVVFMNALGAQNADFIVEETLDRDAGCFEVSPQPSDCARGGTGYYWDESNQTHPNFQDHLAEALAYHSGIGNLPIIWWQTPEGVPSTTPGGTPFHYRDNRVHYFLTHPDELVAVGGLGVVFSNGDGQQTSVATDGGQFQSLSSSYLAAPAALP